MFLYFLIFVLDPSMWSILEVSQGAQKSVYIFVCLNEMLCRSISVINFCSIAYLFGFCLNDLSIDEHWMLKSPPVITQGSMSELSFQNIFLRNVVAITFGAKC